MSKKLLILLLILAGLGVGGFLIYQQIQAVQQRQAYEASSDKVIDDFLHTLPAQDTGSGMKLLSKRLQDNYSEEYWKATLYPPFAGYVGTPRLTAKAPVQPLAADLPNRYDPELQQQATEYAYEYILNGATYRLVLVAFRESGTWKINEVSGGYVP